MYQLNKANVVVDALNQRPMSCEARLAVMGIQYYNQRAAVSNRELVVVMARLAINPTVFDRIRHWMRISSQTVGWHRQLDGTERTPLFD